MREVFEEYGKIILAAVTSVTLIGFATAFLSVGEVFEAILCFSKSIC